MRVGWLAVLAAALASFAITASADPWAALRGGGHVVLVRHALTPAQLGDPPGFRLDDCSTQRNLTEAGKDQAMRIGEAFRARAIPIADIRSSRWCRCLDTARLAFGQVQAWNVLDAVLFDTPAQRVERAAALREELGRPVPDGNRVMVTHNFNLQDALDVSVAMGEALVTAPDGRGGYTVVGRIPAP